MQGDDSVIPLFLSKKMWPNFCILYLQKSHHMKPNLKTIFLFVIVFFSTQLIVAQNNRFVQSVDSIQLRKDLLNGEFYFQLPQDVTLTQVNESAAYYTMYFEVEFDENSKEVMIRMVNNDAKSRHIIVRFFVSLDVRIVKINNREMLVEEYFQRYLK